MLSGTAHQSPVPTSQFQAPVPGPLASIAELVSSRLSGVLLINRVAAGSRAQSSGCLWHVAGDITVLPVPIHTREGVDLRDPSPVLQLNLVRGLGQDRGLKLQAWGTQVSARGFALVLPLRPVMDLPLSLLPL